MARVEINETVLRSYGSVLRPVSGASVQVNIRGAGAATVYSASTGAGTLTNPLTSTAAGMVEGWLEPGSYDLAITKDNLSYTSYLEAIDAEMVQIDPAERSSNAAGGAHTTHATANTYKTVAALAATRREIEVVNDSDTVVYLRLNSAGTRRLAPNGGSWYSALFTGLVESTCASPAKALTVYELLA